MVTNLGQHWPEGTKPLSEPMLTNRQWGLPAFAWEQFLKLIRTFVKFTKVLMNVIPDKSSEITFIQSHLPGPNELNNRCDDQDLLGRNGTWIPAHGTACRCRSCMRGSEEWRTRVTLGDTQTTPGWCPAHGWGPDWNSLENSQVPFEYSYYNINPLYAEFIWGNFYISVIFSVLYFFFRLSRFSC